MSKPLNPALNALFTSAQLPTLPIVASKILELTAQEDAAFSDIVDLISPDMALSAKILNVANSACYSFPQQIASINQAISNRRFGLEVLPLLEAIFSTKVKAMGRNNHA